MSASAVLNVLLVVVVAGWVVRRQVVARPIAGRSLWLLPAILAVVGWSQISHLHNLAAGAPYLAADLGSVVVLGMLRGLTVELFTDQGVAWRRGTGLTVALWAVSFAARIVIGVVASHQGYGTLSSDSLTLSLGASLLAQNLVIAWRAAQASMVLAPSRAR